MAQDNKFFSLNEQDTLDLRALEEQERAILKLEETIRSTNEVYKKFSDLVYVQGSMIDSIQMSEENTAKLTEEGAQLLQQVYKNQTNISNCKIILLLIAIYIVSKLFF